MGKSEKQWVGSAYATSEACDLMESQEVLKELPRTAITQPLRTFLGEACHCRPALITCLELPQSYDTAHEIPNKRKGTLWDHWTTYSTRRAGKNQEGGLNQ